jgi:photosystem II stability/assembly factor-like uncharacterized protein
MRLRFWAVRFVVIVTLLTASGAVVARGTLTPPGGQQLQEAWLLGADTGWVWTQDEAGPVGGGGSQGIELTTDGGRSWLDVTPPGLAVQGGTHWISGLFALNTDDAWVSYGGVGSEATQTIMVTTDGGRTWRAIGPKPPWCALQFVSISDGWCPAIGAALGSETVTLYRTTDGAHSWRIVSRSPLYGSRQGELPFGGDKDIDFTNSRTGWAVFETPVRTAQLFETENSGQTWVARHVTAAPHSRYGGSFVGEPVLNSQYGAVGYSIERPSGSSTILYVSTDSGRDWRPLVPPGPPEPWLVDTLTARSWHLVYGDRILATDNAGRSWRTITTDHRFPALFYSYGSPTPPVVLFASDEIGWVVQQNHASVNTLWRTVDGGSQWDRVSIPGT